MFEDTDNLWTFKYEPISLKEYIASEETKRNLQKIIDDCPNLLLVGPPGTGKSTFSNIFLKETGFDYLKINAALENGVDVIRSKVMPFGNSLGLNKFKIVLFNEASRLTPDAQEILKQYMEDTYLHTRFIFICNSYSKIDPAIISRCNFLELAHQPADLIYDFCMKIISKENIKIINEKEFQKSIVKTIKRLYPDIRRIINCIQGSVHNNELSIVTTKAFNELNKNLLKSFLEKDIENVRNILRNNAINYPELYQLLFDNVDKFDLPGDAIIEIGEALWRDKTVAINEINFLAMMAKMIKFNII